VATKFSLVGIETISLPEVPLSNPDDGTVIGILGVTYNTDNYGVRVLLSGLIQSLAGAIQRPCLRLIDYGPAPVKWVERFGVEEIDVPLVNLRFSWRLYLPNNIARLLLVACFARLLPKPLRHRWLKRNPWLREMLAARVHVSLAGGDSFSDIYGLRRFFYVVLPQLLVLALNRPLVLVPQTYGPFKTRIARAVARFIFQRATLIYSRDEEGVATARKILGAGDPRIRRSPDLGFTMEPEPVPEGVGARVGRLRRTGSVVGLNVSSLLHMGGYSGNNMFGLRDNYPALIESILQLLILELGATVILIPHVFGDPESEECELKLLRRLAPAWLVQYPDRMLFLDQVFNHRQIKSLIGQCELFIGSRMHACIGAVSQCVPTLGLAYSSKFAGVLNARETGARVADLRSADRDEVLGAVRLAFAGRESARDRLVQAMPGLKASARQVFQSGPFLGCLPPPVPGRNGRGLIGSPLIPS